MGAFDTLQKVTDRVAAETLHSGNSKFLSEMAGFVELCEQRVYFGADVALMSPPLRVRDMEISTTLTVTSGVAALPADFLDKRAVYQQGQTPVPLRYQEPVNFHVDIRDRLGAALPSSYTIEGSSLLVSPEGYTGTISLLYYKRYPALTGASDTNWILVNAPGVFYHGILLEAYRYLRNPERRQEAYSDYLSAVSAVNAVQARARTAGSSALRKGQWF